MNRKPVSNPELAALGEFQGTIDRNSNFRQQASNHNLGRNVRVVKLLGYLAMMRQRGDPLAGSIDCFAAAKQNFSSSVSMTHMGLPTGAMQAAHFLPGQVQIGGKDVWKLTTSPKARDQIEFLFAEVEHLPIAFNQADSAAEGNRQGGGLCAALANACAATIRPPSADQPESEERPTRRPLQAMRRVPHPHSPVGKTFDWTSVGLAHPDAPGGTSLEWFKAGLPHPNSPEGRSFSYGAEIARVFEQRRNDGGGPSMQPPSKGILMAIVQAAYDAWHRQAMAGIQNAIGRKAAKAGVPPLVGDPFEGYTPESISARSTASPKQWNRDESLSILEYYLEDQRERTWNWVIASCQEALREVESHF